MISVRSEVGQGTCFRVDTPVPPPRSDIGPNAADELSIHAIKARGLRTETMPDSSRTCPSRRGLRG